MTNLPDNKPSEATEENWTQLEEKYKETIEDLKAQCEISKCAYKYMKLELAAAKESEAAKREEDNKKQMAELEKERDTWKTLAEKVQEFNVAVVKEKKILQYEKEEWMEKAKSAANSQETVKILMNQIEELALENDKQKQKLSKQDEEMKAQVEMVENQLEIERDDNRQLTEENAKLLTKQNQLKEELTELKTQDPLSICKICMDRSVQNIFKCGHVSCSECAINLRECHICRRWINRRYTKVIFF